MTKNLDTIGFRMLIISLITLASASVEAMPGTMLSYSGEFYAELPAEIVRDEKQIKTITDDGQLRRPRDQNQAQIKPENEEDVQQEEERSLQGPQAVEQADDLSK